MAKRGPSDSLGSWFKYAREQKELKAKEVAKELNVQPSTVTRIEKGDFVPGDDLVNKFARKLHLGPVFKNQLLRIRKLLVEDLRRWRLEEKGALKKRAAEISQIEQESTTMKSFQWLVL